jgi:hypothetical protein
LRNSFVNLFQKITFFIILFKSGLIPSIAFAITLESWFEQHVFSERGNTMAVLLDKRYAKRHRCDGEIIWSYFNKKDYSKARALNFSRDGSYFETDRALGVGSTVLIRVLNCIDHNDRSKDPEGIRWNALGEVKSCRELTGGKQGHYGIGVKYHLN